MSFTLTFKPIAAKANISSLLLTALHTSDKAGEIIPIENNAHVIKNPITY